MGCLMVIHPLGWLENLPQLLWLLVTASWLLESESNDDSSSLVRGRGIDTLLSVFTYGLLWRRSRQPCYR